MSRARPEDRNDNALREPLLSGGDGQAQPPPAPAPLADSEAPGGRQLSEDKKLRRRELTGLMFNALSTLFGTGMSLFAKISGSQGIGVFEIVLTRSLILVLFTGPELVYFGINPFQDQRRRWLLVLRGVLGFLSVSSLYLAVSLLPLADASVLSFLSPIFVAMLGPLVLREKTSRGVLLGIPCAMAGVVLVAQPSVLFGGGGNISGLGIAVGICQACFNALARICVRALSLGSSERMSSIIFGQGAISCLGAAILCATTRNFKVPAHPTVWGALLAGGLLGYLYQLALTAGLQRARAAPAVAMSYLSVIWGILADILVFHDLPDNLSLVGASIICLSSFFVAFSQKRGSAHKTADARWQQSSARLQQQGEEETTDCDGTEYASAEEASLRSVSRASSAAPGGGLKVAMGAVAPEGEVQAPDTPATVLLEPQPQHGGHHGSTDSLALLGSSPEASAHGGAGWAPAPAAASPRALPRQRRV